MPSPQADQLTRRFQAEVLRIASLIALRVRTAASRADPADIDTWWEGVSPQIRQEILAGQSATAALARSYLAQHAALEGVQLAPVVVDPAEEQLETALRVTGPVAFKTNMADTGSDVSAVRAMATRLEGSAARMTLEGGRSTVMRTFAERDQVAGWRRVGAGGSCAFCAMLIGRGAVYSKGSADFQAHDHDRCTPSPLYRREPEPASVRRLQEEFLQVTANTTGKASIEAWRKHWDARQSGTVEQAGGE